MPPRGSPQLQSGGQNHNPCRLAHLEMANMWQGGYLTPAASGIPSASERGAESEMAHMWARWLLNPCRLGDPLRFRAGGRIRSGPPCGQGGYLTHAASGIPSASERGAESEMAHLWARWLLNFGDPLQSGGQPSEVAGQGGYAASGTPSQLHSPPPPRGSASERGAESEVAHLWARWLLNPAASGIPSASERGAKSEVAHVWARWLLNSCRLGDPLRFRAGGRIRSGPRVGKVAT